MGPDRVYLEAFGKRVRTARRAKNMTQEALAAAMGVSRSAVAQWETGRAGAASVGLKQLSEILGVGFSRDEILELPKPMMTRGEVAEMDRQSVRAVARSYLSSFARDMTVGDVLAFMDAAGPPPPSVGTDMRR